MELRRPHPLYAWSPFPATSTCFCCLWPAALSPLGVAGWPLGWRALGSTCAFGAALRFRRAFVALHPIPGRQGGHLSDHRHLPPAGRCCSPRGRSPASPRCSLFICAHSGRYSFGRTPQLEVTNGRTSPSSCPSGRQTRILALAKGEGPQSVKQYEPRGVAIVALSLATSNSFAGILLLSTLISQTASCWGRNLPTGSTAPLPRFPG